MSGVRIVLLEKMVHYIKTPLNAILGFSENLDYESILELLGQKKRFKT
ncbi:MAG: hypothetical protein ACYDHW_14640 [Syntrophorhabdaceae bacterium]